MTHTSRAIRTDKYFHRRQQDDAMQLEIPASATPYRRSPSYTSALGHEIQCTVRAVLPHGSHEGGHAKLCTHQGECATTIAIASGIARAVNEGTL